MTRPSKTARFTDPALERVLQDVFMNICKAHSIKNCGLDINKPDKGEIGQFYLATDTFKLYVFVARGTRKSITFS